MRYFQRYLDETFPKISQWYIKKKCISMRYSQRYLDEISPNVSRWDVSKDISMRYFRSHYARLLVVHACTPPSFASCACDASTARFTGCIRHTRYVLMHDAHPVYHRRRTKYCIPYYTPHHTTRSIYYTYSTEDIIIASFTTDIVEKNISGCSETLLTAHRDRRAIHSTDTYYTSMQ